MTFTKEDLIEKAREQIAFCRHTKITGEGRTHVNQCSALFEIALAVLESRADAEPDDYFASLVSAARVRADKAMRKFPQPNYVLNKVAEENGEVIKAVIHYTEGREKWTNVEGEIIDNLAMLIRLVTEGDQVIGFTPPSACRAAMLQGKDEPVQGWIPCSERMPETDGNYWGWWSESKRQGPVWFIKSDLQAQFQSSEITHWMPLPAAPKQEAQEVKK